MSIDELQDFLIVHISIWWLFSLVILYTRP
jgi:hypothetical protein